MEEPRFLLLQEIIKIHEDQIVLFGGSQGLRDINLLESAINEPKATFEGNFLHKNIFNMAASYAYGIIKNHPFVDGNKRTGIVCSLVFLDYNGYFLNASQEDVYSLGISIATSKINPLEIAKFFKEYSVNTE